jgi:Rieske Fe-S protein
MTAMDRRQFVELALGAALCSAGLGCASMVTHRVAAVDGSVRLDLREHPDLLAAGGSLRVLPDGFEDPVYVLALADGSYAAVSPICTHRGCTVDVQGSLLVCPCHGSTYDREGTVLEGPAERPLRRFETRIGDGDVLLIRLEA